MLVANISEAVGRLTVELGGFPLRLRRANRIRTIQGSLAIEGNTLSEEQITALLEGKPVLAPPTEVQEVRNALRTYEQMAVWDSYCEADLLKAHRMLMTGLVDGPGRYRQGGAGVMGKSGIVHVAPPADRVPFQINELIEWLATTDAHPLVASSVFHYEFEFIHPFEDGNGRMGRLWQTLILSQWAPLFADLPVESIIYTHQTAYYAALNESTNQGNCAPFIEFMLQVIAETIAEAAKTGAQSRAQSRAQSDSILAALADDPLSAADIAASLGLKTKTGSFKRALHTLFEAGLIEQTLPDKPTSRLQKYRLTEAGTALLLEGKESA